MPRLSPRLLRHAHNAHPLLRLLLPVCRDLDSARNELRWLQDHAQTLAARSPNPEKWETRLQVMVRQRATGKPLQYILGTEYFGDLEIVCRPGVLIPRQDTAASVAYLARLLQSSDSLPSQLRVLDLCTGTGCIPLLLDHLLSHSHDPPELQLLGVDVSKKCVDLAEENKARCQARYTEFAQADVLAAKGSPQAPSLLALLQSRASPRWDILTSNPPYISSHAFVHTTARSVRNFEPKLALVPPAGVSEIPGDGDLFYPRLLDAADHVQSQVALFEVADLSQALRVASLIRDKGSWEGVEIWRDEPGAKDESFVHIEHTFYNVRILGRGNGRSVVCWRNQGATWLGR
ncbi:S-adenosyl-L-methionine-dependent methyltransferase [Phyllosticta paracitricarpa]|uniref:S-adenosyl-L-methionine-dependent methyltransferase n=1 Tax=Phyllosticta paracitricarpa TaxID=2016321 RepID=A0ABR1N1L1_9PEZI